MSINDERMRKIHKWLLEWVISPLISQGIDVDDEDNFEFLKGIVFNPENQLPWLECLTDPSIDINTNYESIEFIGDKEINLYHTIAIRNRFKDLDENRMNNMVSHLQRNTEQAKILKNRDDREYNLVDIFDVDIPEGTPLNDSIYSDLLEAIIGTLFYTSDNSRSGYGFNISLMYYNYLYEDYFNTEMIPDIIPKTEVVEIIRNARGNIRTLKRTLKEYVYILYIEDSLSEFFSNFGETYERMFKKEIMVKDSKGVSSVYGRYQFEAMLNNNKEDLSNKLSTLYVENEDRINIPDNIIGFYTDTTELNIEYDVYNNAYENFNSISITSSLMKEYKKKKDMDRFLRDNGLWEERNLLLSRYEGRYGITKLEFKIHHKLRTFNSATVSLIGIRYEGGTETKMKIKTVTADDIREAERKLLLT